MITTGIKNSRRGFLGTLALGATAFTARGAFAEELTRTPTTNEGPFFPKKLPLDTDNDLLIINDTITPAVGEITHLSGRLLDAKGTRSATPSSRSGSATATAPTSSSINRARRSSTRTSRDTGDS